jgi:hypothetical protein
MALWVPGHMLRTDGVVGSVMQSTPRYLSSLLCSLLGRWADAELVDHPQPKQKNSLLTSIRICSPFDRFRKALKQHALSIQHSVTKL